MVTMEINVITGLMGKIMMTVRTVEKTAFSVVPNHERKN